MKRQSPIFLSAAAFVLLTSSSVIAEETIRLAFHWPNVVKAKVTVETTIVTTENDAKHRLSDTVTYAFEASAMPDHFLITEKDHAIINQRFDGKVVDTPEKRRIYLRESSPFRQKTYIGQYLVTKNGDFADVHNFIEQYCEHVAMRFGHLKGDAETPEAIAKCRNAVEGKKDPFVDYMRQIALNRAMSDWLRIVGWWVESEMTEREVYESNTTLPEDVPPEKGIPTTDTMKYVGRFPCKKGGRTANCVRVEWVELMDTGKDPRPALELIETLFPALLPKKMPPADPAKPVLGSIRKRTEIHLLTDPDTLLPHWVEEIETVRVLVEGDRANPYGTSTETHSIWTYEYEIPN